MNDSRGTAPFARDVARRGGYAYTTEASLSSQLATRRQTEATMAIADFRGRRIIDVGCGDGTFTVELLRLAGAAAVTGVDPAPGAIEAARRRGAGLPVSFSESTAYELAHHADTFDFAYLRGVLHHLECPREALQEALRVAPRVVVVEPNGYNLGLKLIERYSRYHVEHNERSYAPHTLDRWLHALGARVETRRFAGFVPMFSPDRVARSMKHLEPVVEGLPILRAAACAIYVCAAVRGDR